MNGTKDIFSLVQSGTAFSNPVAGAATAATAALTAIPDAATLYTLAQSQPGGGSITMPQINGAVTAINQAIAAINNFRSHTDKLSGIDTSQGTTLGAIAQAMAAQRTISEDSLCSTFLGAFGAIVNAAQFIALLGAIARDADNFMDNIPGYINTFIQQLTQVVANITDQITADVNMFLAAQTFLIQHALAAAINSLIDDECFSEVLGAIATQPLKNKVFEIQKENERKRQQIRGKINETVANTQGKVLSGVKIP